MYLPDRQPCSTEPGSFLRLAADRGASLGAIDATPKPLLDLDAVLRAWMSVDPVRVQAPASRHE
jgi:hypothetical protein